MLEAIRNNSGANRAILTFGIVVCFATAPFHADTLYSSASYNYQSNIAKEISVNSTDQNQPPRKLAQADITSEVAARYGATVRNIESNGITLRIVEAGAGPLVVLVHGWPESWYSWRHQFPALVEAGYRVVAPDMRGYGGSSIPDAIEDYNIVELTADVVGIVAALGEQTAVVVGHDWGAPIAWQSALLYPEVFTAVVGMSVMYGGRSDTRPNIQLRQAPDDDFFYTRYFQEPGVAEAEFDADPRALIARLYTSRSPGTPTLPPEVTDPRASAGGWLKRLGEPIRLPDWLSEEDLNYYASEFARSGFRGGINYYRNGARNWDLTTQLAGAKIQQPALFIVGELDIVNRGATREEILARGEPSFENLTDVIVLPGIGHRNQQQAPQETNQHLIRFLNSLNLN
jgi:pimeloyl-ACP methyl ester carboxylesterase